MALKDPDGSHRPAESGNDNEFARLLLGLQVYILPTIRINNGQYRGKLAYTEVLQAICAAFDKNNEPEVCLRVSEDDCRPGSLGEANCRAK